MTDLEKLRALKTEAGEAAARGDHERLLVIYRALAAAEPDEPRWLMKTGEVLRDQGKTADAAMVFREAATRYANEGFQLKAVAACRVLLQMVPKDPLAVRLIEKFAPRGSSVPTDAKPAPTASAASSEPELTFDGEQKLTLEHVALAKVLPSIANGDSQSGIHSVQMQLGDAEIQADPGYQALSSETNLTAVVPPQPGSVLPPVETERLVGLPLLGQLPAEVLEGFVERIEHLALAPGDRAITEGDTADRVFIVVRGDLVATRGSPPRPLARIGEGSFFGEMALLEDTPRSASVVAVTDTELLALPRSLVLEICAAHPVVMATLMKSLRTRLIATLTSTSPLFAKIPAAERGKIVARFGLHELDAGTAFIREGTPANGLYLVLTGRADVTSEEVHAATLTTGDVAGEISLLSGEGAEATVCARSRMTVLMLPAADLQALLAAQPAVRQHLAALSERRQAELRTIRASNPAMVQRRVRTI